MRIPQFGGQQKDRLDAEGESEEELGSIRGGRT